MKTIEKMLDKASDEAAMEEVFDTSETSFKRVDPIRKGYFKAGAEWMRDELTRWHDPKEELPDEDSRVLCKVDGCEITEYLVLNYYEGRWWACHPHLDDECSEDSWELFEGTVIGWRYIHE